MPQQLSYSLYYTANVTRELCWFLTATLRSYEHIAFDRTLDATTSLFEFFVPNEMEFYFLDVMDYFQKEGIIHNLQKLPNRLVDLNQEI